MISKSYQESVDSIFKKYAPTKDNLLRCLHELQDSHPQNYLAPEVLDAVSAHYNLSKGQIFGIVSYYTMFSLEPRGRYLIRFCKSPVCHMLGADNLVIQIEKMLGIKSGETTSDGLFTLEIAECLGACHQGPAMMVNKELVCDLTTEKIDQVLNDLKKIELK
jgi:NADH:ubiquinone oxidoreductase subunit E